MPLSAAKSHGASWTFVVWGALQAFFISVERVTDWPKRVSAIFGGKHLCLLVTLFLVVLSWVFFRLQSMGQAGFILTQLIDIRHLDLTAAKSVLQGKVVLFLVFMFARHAYVYVGMDKIVNKLPAWTAAPRPAFAALAITACIFLRGPGSAFIYFQF